MVEVPRGCIADLPIHQPTAVEFARDSPLEGDGFELSVPGHGGTQLSRPAAGSRARERGAGADGAVRAASSCSASVHQVLTNEKYIGNNVFNRASAKLTNKRIANPPEMWVRAVGAFPAIVDPELFRAARTVLARRNRQLSDDEMLALLKDLYAKHGRLSSIIIDQSKDLPVSLSYRQRFGSLGRVYQLVGYVPQRADRSIEINRTLRRLHADVYREVIAKIEQLGGSVARDGPKGLITINGNSPARSLSPAA
jgi:hypothetical protein